MKLGSLKDDGRDGTLALVSRDLQSVLPVPGIAPTLQAALDDWNAVAPMLDEASERLNDGPTPGMIPFEPSLFAAPLPRVFQWADGSAYVNHVELVRKARGAKMPESYWEDPLMYQGGSDSFLGPREPIRLADEDWGIDFESEIAVITDDVPMGVAPEEAIGRIRLITLVNDVSLRNLIPAELGKGFGFFQSKPSTAFAPVAATPDELGDAWRDGKVHFPVLTHLNGTLFGHPEAGEDMTFDFGRLIAHAAMTRPLGAGTIVGSGTVSNRSGTVGSSCISEKRMLETIATGTPTTPFLSFDDRVRIEMLNGDGQSLFGAIEQIVRRYDGP